MAPNPNQIFRDLVAYLSAPSVRTDYAIEALKEYILYRRSKGDSLFEVSIGLAELEEQVSYLFPGLHHQEGRIADSLDSSTYCSRL